MQNLENNPEDMGTYNFSGYTKDSMVHYGIDVAPWIVLGNTYNDTTTQAQRWNAFTPIGLGDVPQNWEDFVSRYAYLFNI